MGAIRIYSFFLIELLCKDSTILYTFNNKYINCVIVTVQIMSLSLNKSRGNIEMPYVNM